MGRPRGAQPRPCDACPSFSSLFRPQQCRDPTCRPAPRSTPQAVDIGRRMRRRSQGERLELEERSQRLANLCQEGWNLVIKDLVNSAMIPEVVIGAPGRGRILVLRFARVPFSVCFSCEVSQNCVRGPSRVPRLDIYVAQATSPATRSPCSPPWASAPAARARASRRCGATGGSPPRTDRCSKWTRGTSA